GCSGRLDQSEPLVWNVRGLNAHTFAGYTAGGTRCATQSVIDDYRCSGKQSLDGQRNRLGPNRGRADLDLAEGRSCQPLQLKLHGRYRCWGLASHPERSRERNNNIRSYGRLSPVCLHDPVGDPDRLSDSQFRPGGPPALSSAQYARDLNETKIMGSYSS